MGGGGGGAARVGKNFPLPIRYLPVPGCLLDNSLVLNLPSVVSFSLQSVFTVPVMVSYFTFLHKNHTKLSMIILVISKRLHRIVHPSKVIVRLQFVFTAGKNCLDRDLMRVLAVLYPFTFATIVSDVGLTTKLQKCLGSIVTNGFWLF